MIHDEIKIKLGCVASKRLNLTQVYKLLASFIFFVYQMFALEFEIINDRFSSLAGSYIWGKALYNGRQPQAKKETTSWG